MNFVIGDIHGEITKLRLLIKHILKLDTSPKLIFIGDYLDKGENVYLTLQYLKDLIQKYHTKLLFGNHEYLWWNLVKNGKTDIEIENYLLKYGAKMTMQSFSSDSIFITRAKMLNEFLWLFQSMVPHYLIDNYLIIHSGLRPIDIDVDIDHIDIKYKLFNRYDFLRNEQLYKSKYRFIFGHTGFYSPYVDSSKIGIDTAACFLPEQPLTAFCIEESYFVNSSGNKTLLKEFSKNVVPIIPRNKPWRYDENA